LARPLAEILADIDSATKRMETAPLGVSKLTAAQHVMRFQREALGTVAVELALRPRSAALPKDVTL
jgi:hypothetical protein